MQVTVPGAIDPDLDDGQAIGLLLKQRPQVGGRWGERVPGTVGATQVGDGRTRRGAEYAVEIGSPPRLAGFQKAEDATPVVVVDDNGQVRARLTWTNEQTVAVMQEREVAHQRKGRSLRLSQSQTDSSRHTPVDTGKSAAGNHGQRRAPD